MSNYAFFSKDSSHWGEMFQSIWGCMDICPLLTQFHVTSITYLELSSLTSLKTLGDVKKFHSNLTYLLVSTQVGTVRDRIYGLFTIWVNPYQARVPSQEETVKQLTALVPTGSDWPYALVGLNGDTCHVPLPREEHLSILVEGTSSAAYRRASQPEAHQLLSLNLQVIYSARLNGCEVPVIAFLPESLPRGTNLLGGKPVYLKVDILQPSTEEPELKMLPLGSHFSPILMPGSIRAPLLKAEGEVSMTMEVRELLSQAILNTSGQASRNSTPKMLNPVVILTPIPSKLGDFPRLVDMSSQVSAPDDTKMGDSSPEEETAISPTAKTPGSSGGTPPTDAGHLWELSMALHWNESKTMKSIREAKAVCTHATQEAKTLCSTTIKEAKATCACSIQEAENLCSRTIMDLEALGASQADSLQWSHAKSIQCMEKQAIKEESKGQLEFLSACQTAP